MAQRPAARAAGAPAGWLGTVRVAALDTRLERVGALGGQVRRPPSTVAGTGRWALVADDAGAELVLLEPAAAAGDPLAGAAGPAWSRLGTADPERASAFYTGLLGWERRPAPGGGWELLDPSTGRPLGEISPIEQAMHTSWTFSFGVPALATTRSRIQAAGGQPLGPPEQRALGRVAWARDPEGAAFGYGIVADAASPGRSGEAGPAW